MGELYDAIVVLFERRFMQTKPGSGEEKVKILSLDECAQLTDVLTVIGPIAAATQYLQSSHELTIVYVPHFVIEVKNIMMRKRSTSAPSVVCIGRKCPHPIAPSLSPTHKP